MACLAEITTCSVQATENHEEKLFEKGSKIVVSSSQIEDLWDEHNPYVRSWSVDSSVETLLKEKQKNLSREHEKKACAAEDFIESLLTKGGPATERDP